MVKMMMNVMVLVVAVVATSVMLHTTDAAVYTVGDDLGWTVPPGGADTYAAWAAKHSFVVNDILVFNFTEGEDDLAIVTKQDFDTCNTTDPLYEFDEPMTLKFLASDTFYFTSTLDGHCSQGQKVAIYIAAAASPSPSPTAAAAPDKLPAASSTVKFVSLKMRHRKRA